MRIIKLDRSIIPACDVNSIEELKQLVKETCDVEGIGAYKIGFELVIPHGMKAVVESIREETDLPIIYDHQKAGTDIPDTGMKFASACKKCGVNAAILFPQAGPETEKAWVKALQENSLGVIVGGEMTHRGYLSSEDGFIVESAPEKMYLIAAELNVRDFVVPGNKPERISHYKSLLEEKGISPVLYSPGLISQGGDITESGKAAGKQWHAIVGRALYNAKDIRAAAKQLTKKLI